MKSIISLCIAVLLSQITYAQIIQNGMIKFERKANIRLQMQNSMSENTYITTDMIKQMPTAAASYFELYFTPNKSIYKFNSHQELQGMAKYFVSQGPARENTVYRDLKTDTIFARKKFYEADYLVKDIVEASDWKFSPEMRVIAGYNCRKATTTLYDSLIIVAFYTDEIIAQSGPESIGGLPGMILGLAIPKLYTTWFATEVTPMIPQEDVFKYNTKGKLVNRKEMEDQVLKATKDWGSYGVLGIWWLKI